MTFGEIIGVWIAAGLTLMMFSFAQMVRPRSVAALPRPAVELRTVGRVTALAAGAALLVGGIWGMVELIMAAEGQGPRVALGLVLVAMVWGLIGAAWPRAVMARPARHGAAAVVCVVGLVIAVVALWPAAELGAGSNALARARLYADQFDSLDRRIASVVNPAERRTYLAERERLRGLAFVATRDTRVYSPWTCDSWRSTAATPGQTRAPEVGGEACQTSAPSAPRRTKSV